MSTVNERYIAYPLGVNSVTILPQGSPTALAGFLCITSGTLTATRNDGTVIINAVPVTLGVYTPMPFYIREGATITLAGGASGTLGVS